MNFSLPDSVPISPEMLRLISGIDQFLGRWQVGLAMEPEKLAGLRRLATIESTGSSTRIEGAKLTNTQVETLLLNLGKQSFATRDEQEVAGYAHVLEQVFAFADRIPLTSNFLRQLHRDLLQFSSKDEKHRGEWKTHPNHVAAFDPDGQQIGIVFQTSSPFDTPRQMDDLLDWHRRNMNDTGLHPLLRIGVFIVIFLAIHPFQDGNGRLSRVLTLLLLLQAGYAYVPYSSLESLIEHNKHAYYQALRRTQITWQSGQPDWETWLLFFLRTLHQQTWVLQHRLSDNTQKSTSPVVLTPDARKILGLLEHQATLTSSEAAAATGIPLSTVKTRLKELLAAQRIEAHGRGKGVFYQKSKN